MEEEPGPPPFEADAERGGAAEHDAYVCDRCGSAMIEKNCKVVCLNCGNRFDCSDLTLYFD